MSINVGSLSSSQATVARLRSPPDSPGIIGPPIS